MWLKSSKTHTERLNDINFKKVLEFIPEANLKVASNGRLVNSDQQHKPDNVVKITNKMRGNSVSRPGPVFSFRAEQPLPYVAGRTQPLPYVAGGTQPLPYVAGRTQPLPYVAGGKQLPTPSTSTAKENRPTSFSQPRANVPPTVKGKGPKYRAPQHKSSRPNTKPDNKRARIASDESPQKSIGDVLEHPPNVSDVLRDAHNILHADAQIG